MSPLLSRTIAVILLIVSQACRSGATTQTPDGNAPGGRSLKVITTHVESQDIDVSLWGLGNALAFYTATVKAQVDGKLVTVNFKEGDAVKKGDLLAQIDPRPFDIAVQQADASLARDVASLRNGVVNLKRYQDLFRQKLVSEQNVSDLAAQVESAEATVLADKAALNSAKLNREYCDIKAPIAGRTGMRQLDPGNLVRATDANGLVVITQLEPMAVVFTLPEDHLPKLARALAQGTVKAQAYPRGGDRPLSQGVVTLIDNQINAQAGTLRLKAVFDNAETVLWPNQFVRVHLVVETLKQALVLSQQAIMSGPQGDYVWRIHKGIASMQKVTVAQQVGDMAVISNGIAQHDEIVVEGGARLYTGARVEVAPAKDSGASTQ